MRSIRCVVAEMKIGVASVSSYLSLVRNTNTGRKMAFSRGSQLPLVAVAQPRLIKRD
jgi:hypothetical protein